MFHSIRNKFLQNDELAHMLLSTGNIPIVKAVTGDRHWSIGVSINDEELKDQSKWTGLNAMGDILLIVRRELEFSMMNLDGARLHSIL